MPTSATTAAMPMEMPTRVKPGADGTTDQATDDNGEKSHTAGGRVGGGRQDDTAVLHADDTRRLSGNGRSRA